LTSAGLMSGYLKNKSKESLKKEGNVGVELSKELTSGK